MKSSISSLIKGKRSRGVTVNVWNPTEFVGATQEEADELRMLAEGVTDPNEWVGQDAAESAQGVLHRESTPGQDEATAESLREVAQALIQKRQLHSNTNTSVFFKASEINAENYVWPTLEMLSPPPPVEETQEDLIPENPPEPVIDMEAVNAEIQQILDDARRQAEASSQETQVQAQHEAETILQQAHAQSEEIISAARSREAEITQNAFQQGMQAAEDQAGLLLDSVQEIIRQTQAWHEQMLANSETELVSLLKEIARSLFGNGAALGPEILGEAISQAIQEAKPLGNLRIRIHPEDLEALGPLWVQQQTSILGVNVEMSAAEDIRRGGCIIEGNYGTLDGRVDARLERALEVIQDVQTVHTDDQAQVPADEDASIPPASAETSEPETDDDVDEAIEEIALPVEAGEPEATIVEENNGVIDLSAAFNEGADEGQGEG